MTETLVQWFVKALGGSAAKGDSDLRDWKSDSRSFYPSVYHKDFQLAEGHEKAEAYGGKAGSKSDEKEGSGREI